MQAEARKPTFDTCWAELVQCFLGHARETPQKLDQLLTNHPDAPIGHIAKGFMLLLLAKGELRPVAAESLKAAQERLDPEKHDGRDHHLAQALSAWLSGDPKRAVSHIERVIARHPLDAFSVKLSQAIRFMMGDAEGMRHSLARVVSIYRDHTPFAGYIRGCYAFALEETGAHIEAETMGRNAVALEPLDAWGRHAVAHVLEMTGRANDGKVWLGTQSSWRHCGNFGFHLFWHRALFHLELGETSEALALYDTAIRAEQTDDFRDIANAASLLERLELAGVPLGQRWQALADCAEQRVGDRQLVFADLHLMLALVNAGRSEAASRLVETLISGEGIGHDARIARDIAAPAATAILAFHAGNHRAAADLMEGALIDMQQIGGSHAQRDVFSQIYLESLVRSGREAAPQLLARIKSRNGHNLFAQQRLQRLAQSRKIADLTGLALGTSPAPLIVH
jgi:tetratricopeptide (TPR) repeat protein